MWGLLVALFTATTCYGLIHVSIKRTTGRSRWLNRGGYALLRAELPFGGLGGRSALRMSTVDDNILRKVDKWACIKDCGACCKLGPLEDRPDLPDYLTEQELDQYKSMIGPDNYCNHYDREKKMCTIYEDRPSFCVVKPEKMKTMFDIDEEEINDFCAFCCREQISDAYGEESDVMERFEEVIASLRDEDDEGGIEVVEGGAERTEGEFDPVDGGKWISIDIDPNDPSNKPE